MKRFLSVLIAILMLLAACCAYAEIAVINGFAIDVPGAWTNSASSDNETIYMTGNLDVVSFQTAKELDSMIGPFAGTEMAESMIKMVFEQIPEIKADTYRTYDLGPGIQCIAVDLTFNEYDATMAILLSKNGLLSVTVMNMLKLPYDIETILQTISLADQASDAQPSDVSVDPAPDNRKTDDGFYIGKTPLSVRISEDDYNVFYPGMPRDAVSLSRQDLTYDVIDMKLNVGTGYDMFICGIDQNPIQDPEMITIRIKDDKYSGYDFRTMDEVELNLMINAITSGGEWELVNVNGIPYAIFEMVGTIRYASIINGDMVYIFGSLSSGISKEDMLKKVGSVVENVFVAE